MIVIIGSGLTLPFIPNVIPVEFQIGNLNLLEKQSRTKLIIKITVYNMLRC